MRRNISKSDLQYLVDELNKVTNNPIDSYTKTNEGQYRANIGNYHLSWAYGGVSLQRMTNEGGGVSNVSHSGHGTKRELYNYLIALLDGIELAQGK